MRSMKNRFFSISAVVTAAAIAGTAMAADYMLGDITVGEPWARASAGKARNGAAYMTIRNAGAADRLVAASAKVSKKAELHTHIRDGDVMRMRRVDAINLDAYARTKLEPGGLHVMLMGLNAPLKEGDSFPLTLTFERAGEVTVDVPVRKAGAMGDGAMHGHGSGHGGMGGGEQQPGHMKMKTQ